LRQQKKAATKLKILNTAKRLLEQQGYQATTIRQIATESKIGTGTLFDHFENKEVLFYHAFYEELQKIMTDALASVSQYTSLKEQIEHVFGHFFNSFAEQAVLYSHFLEHALLATGEWGERFKAQVSSLGQALGELYHQAKTKGEISEETHIPTAVMAVFSFYYFLLLDSIKSRFSQTEASLQSFSLLLAQHLNGLTRGQA
jgi:AcrR family transcriptional regulator